MAEILYSLQEIQQLYKLGDYNKCFNAIDHYLISNPNDNNALDLLGKVKKQILTQNIKKIDEAINQVKHLWSEKKYKELLNSYFEIQKYAPDYKYLQKLIKKAYQCYTDQLEKTNANDLKKIQEIIDVNLKNKDLQGALKFIEKSIFQEPDNPLLKKLLIDTERKIIDAKIEQNQNQFNKSSITQVCNFLKSLYDLEPTYPKIQKLVLQYHQLSKEYFANQKILFTKDSIRQIKILYNNSEFEKTIQACDEFLRTTNFNRQVVNFKKKARNALINQNFTTAYKKLDTYLKSI